MTDIENVIRGIKHESRNSGKCGHYCPEEYAAKCPYDPDGLCIIHWGADALALLKAEPPKEQEPRVLTLEEVLAWAETPAEKRDPVFFEQKKGIGPSGWICNSLCPKEYYLCCLDKDARCWTSRPTDEQRKAAEWE